MKRFLAPLLLLAACQSEPEAQPPADTLSAANEPIDTVAWVDTFTVRKPQSFTSTEQAERDLMLADAAEQAALIGGGHDDDNGRGISEPGNQDLVASPDAPPQFPGGDAGLRNYINRHLFYPSAAYQNNIRGVVMVRFVIETDGSVSGVAVTRSLGPDCDAAAIRVVEDMPFWTAARKNNTSVRTAVTLPINFDPGE